MRRWVSLFTPAGRSQPAPGARAVAENAEMVDSLRARDRARPAALCVAHMQPSREEWLRLRAAGQIGSVGR